MTTQRRAFTLIELLVVIAIIAILAAILFPVFAQAKLAAKKTQAISNLKNIGTAAQLYMGDYDDVWVLWSAGMGCTAAMCPPRPGTSDAGSVFDLRFMYPSLVDPYIKNGVNTTDGSLKDIWASPVSKPMLSNISNTWAYNHWTLGGFSTCARNINPLTSGVCVTRSTADYAEFADLSYNFPVSATGLAAPAETIAFSDGAQLSRPPQYGIASPTADALNIGVWGPYDMREPTLFGPGGASTRTGSIARLQAGRQTAIVYADGHVKTVPMATVYGNMYYTAGWRGALTNNKGWSRNWGN
ncbi:prepilin-type N-terminal cleavage/methylation domain-containing protein [bacterium]|nr:MAG: prepilin-type N-terminal cleavage/methylation domain-containing protein [bacterium]